MTLSAALEAIWNGMEALRAKVLAAHLTQIRAVKASSGFPAV